MPKTRKMNKFIAVAVVNLAIQRPSKMTKFMSFGNFFTARSGRRTRRALRELAPPPPSASVGTKSKRPAPTINTSSQFGPSDRYVLLPKTNPCATTLTINSIVK